MKLGHIMLDDPPIHLQVFCHSLHKHSKAIIVPNILYSHPKKTSICWVKVIRSCEIERYALTNNTFFYCHISPPLDRHIASKVVGEVVGISFVIDVAYNASLFVCQVGIMHAILYHRYVLGNETVQTMLMR